MKLVDEQATKIVVVENTFSVLHQEVLVELEPLRPDMLDLGEEQPIMNDHEDMDFEENEQGIMVIGKRCNYKETFLEHEKVKPLQVEVPNVPTITPKKTHVKHQIFQETRERRPIGSLNSPKVSGPLLAEQF
jgi:hypothetical protein